MNTLVVITWIISRTVGVPVGPEAGESEPIGFVDVLATSFEAVLVTVASALALRPPAAGRALRALANVGARWATAFAVVGLTALALALLP
ncbi:MAG: hypothetical protein ACRDPC_12435 [Solirubrobacteraceae bacterium]